MSLNPSITLAGFHSEGSINKSALKLAQDLVRRTGRNSVLYSLASLEFGEPLSVTVTPVVLLTGK